MLSKEILVIVLGVQSISPAVNVKPNFSFCRYSWRFINAPMIKKVNAPAKNIPKIVQSISSHFLTPTTLSVRPFPLKTNKIMSQAHMSKLTSNFRLNGVDSRSINFLSSIILSSSVLLSITGSRA